VQVLLTGHLGYVGIVMVPVLEAAGHDVIRLDTGFFADCVPGPLPRIPPAFRWICEN
jgi:nucleoside-diphosphate-sugar epimerase